MNLENEDFAKDIVDTTQAKLQVCTLICAYIIENSIFEPPTPFSFLPVPPDTVLNWILVS